MCAFSPFYSGGLARAIIGQYDRSKRFQNEIIQIKSIHPHEKFGTDDLGLSYDQMVVILKKPSKSTTHVKVNLSSNIPSQDDTITVIGFGVTEDGGLSSKLKTMDGSYLTNDECSNDIGNDFIQSDMVCLLGDSNSRQCRGDSGGPWIIRGDSPENDVQIATVSW